MKNTGQCTKSTPLYDLGPLTFDFWFLLINDNDCEMQLSTLNSNISRCYLYPFVHNLFFFRFPPAAGGGGALAPIRGNLLCLHLLPWAPPYCNKLGSQAPRRGMLFWPILQHCSNSIDLLGDCSNSWRHCDVAASMTSPPWRRCHDDVGPDHCSKSTSLVDCQKLGDWAWAAGACRNSLNVSPTSPSKPSYIEIKCNFKPSTPMYV